MSEHLTLMCQICDALHMSAQVLNLCGLSPVSAGQVMSHDMQCFNICCCFSPKPCNDPAYLCMQELENALSCKYVAANAVSALQQVYQLMGSNAREKATSLQAWARILLKPELRRVVEACQLLEQVAIEKVQLGGSYAQAQSKNTAVSSAALMSTLCYGSCIMFGKL